MFLADRGDDELEDDELRVLIGALGKVAGEHGLPRERAVELANEAAHAYAEHRGAGLEAQAELFHGRCLTLAEVSEDLPRLYRELVQVAVSDGDMEPGEAQILQHVRALWHLDD